jgi:3-deoxy-D-manno-octulosonate 8-phosphate phosphatase KdsC-like HAD superfamily phosphatase
MPNQSLFERLTFPQKNALSNFKVFLTDWDGCHTNGTETRIVIPKYTVHVPMDIGAPKEMEIPQQTGILKSRSLCDGQGVSFLRAIGIEIVIVSGEKEPLNTIIQKWNELPSCQSGAWKPVKLFSGKIGQGNKVDSISEWLSQHEYEWSDCAYFGDDLNDVGPMRKAYVTIAPKNAQRCIAKIPGVIITSKYGGDGAMREIAETILDCRGIDEASLAPA